MKKSKTLLLVFSAMALVGVGASMASSIKDSFEQPVVAKAETVNIGSLDDFKNVFNKGAGYVNHDINLTADIDVSTYLKDVENGGQCGMAGEYAGTFNGNGHVIKGIGGGTWGANVGALFNIVGSGATIKNLVIDWTATRDNVGSIGYMNHGTLENVTVITRVPGAPNSFGAFFAQNGGGTYKNCNSNFIITGGMGGAVGAVSFGGAPDAAHVINCNFTRVTSGNGNTAAANDLQNFTQVDAANIYASASKTTTIGTTIDLTQYTVGIPGIWQSDNEAVATVENGVVTAVSAGSANISVTMSSDYSSSYSKTSAQYAITVEGASNVSAISINETDVSVPQTKVASLSATLTGTEYQSITWESDDTNVATVAGEGLSATVTGVNTGTANITVSVVSNDGNTYTDTIAVTVTEFTVITKPLPWSSTKFNPSWQGAGILGLYIDRDAFEGTTHAGDGANYKNYFDFNLVVTKKDPSSSAAFKLANWQFDDFIEGAFRLYLTFDSAPAANSGWYSLDLTLNYEYDNTKYVYTDSMMFDGVTRVETNGTVSGSEAFGVGEKETFTANFNYFSGSEYTWSVEDTSIISLTESKTNTVEATSLKEGKTKITCTVVENGVEYKASMDVEVVAAVADVTEISVDMTEVSLKESKTQDVNLTFVTGTQYQSIAWTSGNESIATVVGNGKTATITGVAAGETTVTVTVTTASGNLTKDVKIVVLEAEKMTIYLAIPDNFVNLGNTGYGVFLYGKVEGTACTAVDTGVDILLTSTTREAGTVASVYAATINLDSLNVINEADPLWMQICSATNSGARWGGGFNINDCYNNKQGAVITCEDWSKGSTQLKTLANESDVNAALTFSDIRDESNSICYLLSDNARLTQLVNDYNALTPEVRAVVDSLYETEDHTYTFADTMNYLSQFADYTPENVSNATSELVTSNINNFVPVIVLMVLGLSSVGIYYFLKKKASK